MIDRVWALEAERKALADEQPHPYNWRKPVREQYARIVQERDQLTTLIGQLYWLRKVPAMAYDPEWAPVEVSPEEYAQRDPLGIFDAAKCPTCNALTKDGICLNTCHLSPATRSYFYESLAAFNERRKQ